MKKVVLGTALLSSLVQPEKLDQLIDLRISEALGLSEAQAYVLVNHPPETVNTLRGVFRLEKPVQYASFEGGKEAFVELVVFDVKDTADKCAKGRQPMNFLFRLVDTATGKTVATTRGGFIGLMKGENAAPNRYTNFDESTGYCVEGLHVFDYSADFKQVIVDISLYRKYHYGYNEITFANVQVRPRLTGPMHFVRVK